MAHNPIDKLLCTQLSIKDADAHTRNLQYLPVQCLKSYNIYKKAIYLPCFSVINITFLKCIICFRAIITSVEPVTTGRELMCSKITIYIYILTCFLFYCSYRHIEACTMIIIRTSVCLTCCDWGPNKHWDFYYNKNVWPKLCGHLKISLMGMLFQTSLLTRFESLKKWINSGQAHLDYKYQLHAFYKVFQIVF